MAVELHLPDLPEVPISLGLPDALASPLRERMPWPMRLRDGLASYLPLLLMALLALATWWLVKHTPTAPTERTPNTDPGVPDYTMQRFTLQRFGADGRLRVQIEGRELRHYPQSDRIEIDHVELRAMLPDGRETTATARRAVSNGAASQVQLLGGAEVIGSDADGQRVEIRSEYLQALLESEVVSTNLPVELRRGRDLVRAGGLSYDGKQRFAQFTGPVRATLQPPPRR
ncbi:MAG: LPS export ABC transporter periplasmic protein LptC [Rubrivivax sp.]